MAAKQLLIGEEVSCMAFSDGSFASQMLPAQDHKRANDGDEGPNTGGMGAYAPAPCLTAELKPKVIDAPEILQVIGEVPHLTDLQEGMYNCEYKRLMRALVNIIDTISADRYLHLHARYYWRELRVLAYTQFLESYRSVSLASMANSFGVSGDFLDKELSGFIAMERLSCKIDKVNGVVSSTRPDTKNAQYQSTIKQGDLLLNRLQKLSRVINI